MRRKAIQHNFFDGVTMRQMGQRISLRIRVASVFFSAIFLVFCHPSETRAECVGCEVLLIPLAIPVADVITSRFVYRHYVDESPSYGAIYLGGLIGGVGGAVGALLGSGLAADDNDNNFGLWMFVGAAGGLVIGNVVAHKIQYYLAHRKLSIAVLPTRNDSAVNGLELRLGLTF